MRDTPAPFVAVPSPTIDRFARDWRAMTDKEGGARTLVALSGGPDSSALLLLLAAIAQGDLHAATVDHGLRAEAADEAAQAGALAAACGVPHAILAGRVPDRAAGTANLSVRARVFRYALLEKHAAAIGARWIVTAHHADDQLETMMMRLNRGAGLRGMAGVRAVQDAVVRPLLGWRRAALRAVVDACGVAVVEDPTNADDRFDRARLRKRLADADWLDPVAASRSAAALADAAAAVDWMVERLAAERCAFGDGEATVRALDLPVELRRRLVERALAYVAPAIGPRGAEIGRVVARLDVRGGGTLGGVRYGIDGQGGWLFRPAPPRRGH